MNWKTIIGIGITIGLAILLVFKLKANKEITEGKVYQYDRTEIITVGAEVVQKKNAGWQTPYSGIFEPNRETKISAETQGRINSVMTDVGRRVSQNQPLIQLDHSLLDLNLQSIEVNIDGLKNDIRRYTILTEADAIQGVQLEKTQQGLASAEVQRASVLEQIKKSTIHAPFSGIVTAKMNEVGGFAAPGVPLLQITDIATLKFTIQVTENDLTALELHQDYQIKSDAYPEIPFTGKLIMIGSKANPGNSFPVQFSVKNTPDLKIKAGMFGEVKLSADQEEEGIIIPSAALIGSADQPRVYLVKEQKAVLQDVVVSHRIRNQAVIAEGLKEGDVLITRGFINLFENANVNVNVGNE